MLLSRTLPALTRDDRLRHILVVGKTGMGKSTLLRELCRHDIEHGYGLLLIDPHGDLAEAIRGDLPRRRKNDLVMFDAANAAACPGLNPLRSIPDGRNALVVSTMLATLRKLWATSFWGPRLEHVLRNALLALTEVRGATIEDAQNMLVDENHRRWVLKQVRNDLVLQFWVKEFSGYGAKFSPEVTAPILNKLGAILASPAAREILTKRRPYLDARKAMDRSNVVLASLAKGKIGEDSTLLLGGLLLGAFQHATMSRADVPEAERRQFFLVVDEVLSFAAPPFLQLMAEARKYAVGLVLATQSLSALDATMCSAFLGNVGTLIVFRSGAQDAALLAEELGDGLVPQVLMDLGIGDKIMKVGTNSPVLVPRAL